MLRMDLIPSEHSLFGSFKRALSCVSSTLNTEIGVMIDSPEIARQAAKIMDD